LRNWENKSIALIVQGYRKHEYNEAVKWSLSELNSKGTDNPEEQQRQIQTHYRSKYMGMTYILYRNIK